MRRIGLFLAVLLVWCGSALALEVSGVKLAPSVELAGEKLQLNGHGIRKKFFFKIYIGSLYTARPLTTADAVLADPGGKLIRMDFLYKKVEREKIVEAFAEGFANNSPALAGSEEAKAFLGWFDNDFVSGDQVDLALAADGTVSATHNGRELGSLKFPELARGGLLIYLGNQPADEDMKQGMLAGR